MHASYALSWCSGSGVPPRGCQCCYSPTQGSQGQDCREARSTLQHCQIEACKWIWQAFEKGKGKVAWCCDVMQDTCDSTLTIHDIRAWQVEQCCTVVQLCHTAAFLLLPHCCCHIAAAKLLLPHSVTAPSLLLPCCYCHTAAFLLLLHCCCHTAAATLLLPHCRLSVVARLLL